MAPGHADRLGAAGARRVGRTPSDLAGRQETKAVRTGSLASNKLGEGGSVVGGQGEMVSALGGQDTPAVPGTSGVTPGAVERRLNFSPPTQQAAGGLPQPASMQARFENPGFMQNKPNLMAPGRGEMNAPVGNIQNFLTNLQQRNGRGR